MLPRCGRVSNLEHRHFHLRDTLDLSYGKFLFPETPTLKADLYISGLLSLSGVWRGL